MALTGLGPGRHVLHAWLARGSGATTANTTTMAAVWRGAPHPDRLSNIATVAFSATPLDRCYKDAAGAEDDAAAARRAFAAAGRGRGARDPFRVLLLYSKLDEAKFMHRHFEHLKDAFLRLAALPESAAGGLHLAARQRFAEPLSHI